MPVSNHTASMDYWFAEYKRFGMTMDEAAKIAIFGANALGRSSVSNLSFKLSWYGPLDA